MTERRTVVIERSYTAPAERVWRAWVDPEILGRWFGCDADNLWDIHEWDVRPGGRLRVSMEMADAPFEVTGTFLTVEPPTLLRYTFGGDNVVAVGFHADGARTRVVVEHAGLPDERQCAFVTDGWTQSLTALGIEIGGIET